MNYARILSNALTIGEEMLRSGAEVSRVEDSISRICSAYGAQRVDIFTITATMVASCDFEGKTYTQTRRIKSHKTDLSLLDNLNSLSRKICAQCPDQDFVENELSRILATKGYPFPLRMLGWALTAGSFTVFFGGGWIDGLVSAIIGALLMVCVNFVEKKGFNKVYSNLISSFFVSLLAYLSVWAGIGVSSDKIIIGNIMLLIPGLALTNSLRDLIGGDIVTGALRFFEACLIALAIAGGYIITVFIAGGVM